MSKKITAMFLSALMAVVLLAGCGGGGGATSTAGGTSTPPATSTPAAGGDESTPAAGGEGESVSLRVWGPQEEQSLLKEMCEAFAAEHPENTYSFEYGVISEMDAMARYSEDPAAAADVFMFANDQLRDFVGMTGLYEVTRNKEDIVSRNMAGSIEAASLDGVLYGYPMTADNGYFMYYDKSVFSEEDLATLDGMLAVANEKGKKIMMDIDNGWYSASFFLGAGCTIGLDADGKQTCDFNSADGLAAAEAIKAFTADPAFLLGDDDILKGAIGSSIAAGVSGTWNAADISEILGENYGAAKLPTFTKGGQQVQMASFAGYKLVGVNSLTQVPVHAMDLADYITNEENQAKRFELRKLGPANTVASESPAVQADIALSALAQQNSYGIPQTDVLGNFWNPMEAFGAALAAKDYSTDLPDMLDNLVSQITA